MGRHAGSTATLDARPITASTATAALRARRRHHLSAAPSTLFTPATGLRQEAFDELACWQDQQFTALQQAVEEAFTEAVHDLVRPYVDPERRGGTGSLPVLRDLATVPPPVVANPATEIDLDDQPTRQLARTSASRRELRSRQKEREHARVVLARKLATGGALAAAAFGTVTFVGPKMHNGLGSGAAVQVSLADGPSASVADAALALGAGKPAAASGGPAAADAAGVQTVSSAASGAGAAVVTLMQNQIAAEAVDQARNAAADAAASASAARAAAAAKSSRSTARAAAPAAPVVKAPTGSPKAIAMGMLGSFGWSSGQFQCLNLLWTRESGWNYRAINPSSGAGGIPQALPMSKMSSAGSDYRTNPATQIKWGLGYIKDRYGSPCAAWAHSQATNWY